MKLSIAMIVKNEEKNLERTLKALEPLKGKIDYEIVIVDTGSEDNTINIAKKFTDRVYEHKWTGNFGEMRNISVNYCKGEWILVLDADEVIEDADRIVDFFKSGNSEKYCSAEIQFKNFVNEDEKNYFVGSLFRLFKNIKDFKYEGRVHEQPKVFSPYVKSNIMVLHYGYSRADYNLMIYKYERNVKILLKDLKEGVRPLYTRFQLAQTYAMANKHREALDIIKEAYILDKKTNDDTRNINVAHFYAMELLKINNYEKAIEVSNEIIQYNDKNIDFYYIVGSAYFSLHKYEEAIEQFEKYFKMHDEKEKGIFVEDPLTENVGVEYTLSKKNDIVLKNILALSELKKYKDIFIEFNKIDKEDEDIIKALEDVYIYSLLKLRKFDEIKKYFNEFDDEKIDLIRKVIMIYDNKENDIKIEELCKKLLGINDKLDLYLKNIYLDKKVKVNFNELNLEEYHQWKSILFRRKLSEDSSLLSSICELNDDLINQYVFDVISDYNCLKSLVKFSKDNFLEMDRRKLYFLTTVEKILVFNKCISEEDYEELVFRTMINRINYISQIYLTDILESDTMFLPEYDRMMMDFVILIKNKRYDKIEFIKGLRNLLDKYKSYNKLINVFKDKIDETPISEAMISEKDKIIDNIENIINNSSVNETLNTLLELDKMFIFDYKLISNIGALYYYTGDKFKSIFNLSFAYCINNKDFETTYNLANILMDSNKEHEAKYFYKKSLDLCTDKNIYEEIKKLID